MTSRLRFPHRDGRSAARTGEIDGDGSPSGLKIHLLGSFSIERDGVLLPDGVWQRRAARTLVKMLAIQPALRLHREQVLELLWPDLHPEIANDHLYKVLSVARHVMEPELPRWGRSAYIQVTDEVIGLTEAALWIDIRVFEGLAAAAIRSGDKASYERALATYTGELLPEDRYEDWTLQRREELTALHVEVLVGAAALDADGGDNALAIERLRRAVQVDPTREDIHRELMRLYAHDGRSHLAVRQYQHCVQVLARHLEVGPEAETVELYREIAEARGREGVGLWISNLPDDATPFIGRQLEMAEIAELTRRPQVRMVTLTGPGGTGKTRLALQTVKDLQGDYRDGAAAVFLAAVADPALVAPAIAESLGLKPAAGDDPLEAVAGYLEGKQLLLLLDNYEHLLEAVSVVAALLDRCREVRLIVTSRSPLRLRRENRYPVAPLLLPDRERLPELSILARNEAVALFVDRAMAVRPEFRLTMENAESVVDICARLEGLPLAIELAAARIAHFSPRGLVQRLHDTLGLLTGGASDRPAKERTLRGTIEWSYALLTPEEQRLLARLSVFPDGCTLEAAEAVTCSEARIDVMEELSSLVDRSLVDRSLVRLRGTEEPRFDMLEAVRAFAFEKLTARGEATAIAERHARYYLGQLEAGVAHYRWPGSEREISALAVEIDNIRASLRTAREVSDVELGLRLAAAFWPLVLERGHLDEGERWLQEFRAHPAAVDASAAARVRAALSAGKVRSMRGYSDEAWTLLQEALALARESRDDASVAAALEVQAGVEATRGNYGVAQTLYEESMAIYIRLGDRSGQSAVLRALGGLARFEGDFGLATTLYGRSLDLARETGDTRTVADVLARLGNLLADQGRAADALPLYQESLALRRRSGDRLGIADVLYRIGSAATDIGEYGRAMDCYVESGDLYRALGNHFGLAYVLMNQGEAALGMGDTGAARGFDTDALELFRAIDDRRCIALVMRQLGDVARDEGMFGEALARYRESLALHRELRTRPGIAWCLESMTRLACAEGAAERSARLHGATVALWESMSAVMPPAEAARYEADIAAIRERAGSAAFAAWATQGAAMDSERAVDYALGEDRLDDRAIVVPAG